MTQVKGLIEVTSGATLEQILTDSIPFAHNDCVDPFQRHWNTPGVEHYQPCYMPSRTRNANMKLLREIEEHSRLNAPFVSPFCEHVRFCKDHNEHADVVTVNRCEFCYCEAFRAGKEAGKIDRFRGYRSEYSSFVERAPSYTQCYAKGYNEGQRGC